MQPELSAFLSRLLVRCLEIRQVWSLGHAANDPAQSAAGRELLAFADQPTLEQLRKATDLHRRDIELLVVTDGERFENAWGPGKRSGSLARWAWRETSAQQAHYDEARWAEDGEAGTVVRVRRSAFLLWPAIAETVTAARDLRGSSFTPWENQPSMLKL